MRMIEIHLDSNGFLEDFCSLVFEKFNERANY